MVNFLVDEWEIFLSALGIVNTVSGGGNLVNLAGWRNMCHHWAKNILCNIKENQWNCKEDELVP